MLLGDYMAFVYEFKMRRALALGALVFGMLYCGDACNVTRPVKNATRIVRGIKVDPLSVNPYRVDIEPVVEERHGRKWLSTDLVYQGMRFRLDYEAQTPLTRERLEKSPVAHQFIDDRVGELVREYAATAREPVVERPGFFDKASEYVRDKLQEFRN